MAEHGTWHWQEPGTAWRGVGVYHITLTLPSREPLLGRLVIPDCDPSNARIERTALGNAVVDELYVMCRHYPVIRILQFCLMPDHLHAVIQVTQVMETSIRSVIRGYWQGVKKHGRAYTLAVAAGLNPVTMAEGGQERMEEGGQQNTMDEGGRLEATKEGGYAFPVFTERPFIRPLSRRGQLQTMIRYVQLNPQRLATKRLRPGYFRVQKDVEIGQRKYDGVGNVAILMGNGFDTVHVRSMMVEAAKHGETEALRNYMNSRVLKARGRVLILSPWPFDAQKRHISRAECVQLNTMAEEICEALNPHGNE